MEHPLEIMFSGGYHRLGDLCALRGAVALRQSPRYGPPKTRATPGTQRTMVHGLNIRELSSFFAHRRSAAKRTATPLWHTPPGLPPFHLNQPIIPATPCVTPLSSA